MSTTLVENISLIHDLLDKAGQTQEAKAFQKVLVAEPESDEFWTRLASIDIWGGAGSVFDQAFVEYTPASGLTEKQFRELQLLYLPLLREIGQNLIQSRYSTRFVERAVNALPSIEAYWRRLAALP